MQPVQLDNFLQNDAQPLIFDIFNQFVFAKNKTMLTAYV